MRVKLVFGDDTRALEVDRESTTLDSLAAAAAELFGLQSPPRLAHIDADGDTVTLGSDAELRALTAAAAESGAPLRVTLRPQNQQQSLPAVDLVPLMRAMLADPQINEMLGRMVAFVLHQNAPAIAEAVHAAAAAAVASSPAAGAAAEDFEAVSESASEADDRSAVVSASATPATSPQPTAAKAPAVPAKKSGSGTPKPFARVGALFSSLMAAPQAAEAERQRRFESEVAETEAALREMGLEQPPNVVPELLRKHRKKEAVIEALLVKQQQQQQHPKTPATMDH